MSDSNPPYIKIAPGAVAPGVSPYYVCYTTLGYHLFEAIAKDDINPIHEMAHNHINFSTLDDKISFDPLVEAVKREHIKVLNALMYRGADPRLWEPGKIHENPYYIAAKTGKLDVIDTLNRQKPPCRELKLAMISAAIGQHYITVLRRMNEQGMLDVFKPKDVDIGKILNHKTLFITEDARAFLTILYENGSSSQALKQQFKTAKECRLATEAAIKKLAEAAKTITGQKPCLKRRPKP